MKMGTFRKNHKRLKKFLGFYQGTVHRNNTPGIQKYTNYYFENDKFKIHFDVFDDAAPDGSTVVMMIQKTTQSLLDFSKESAERRIKCFEGTPFKMLRIAKRIIDE